jgi:hypothetical protein
LPRTFPGAGNNAKGTLKNLAECADNPDFPPIPCPARAFGKKEKGART